MNKYLKKSLALLMAFILLISCYVPSVALSSSQIEKYSSNTGIRGQVCTSLSSDAVSYYRNNNIDYDSLCDDGSTAIKSALANLMKSTHDYISTYDDCHYAAHKTDSTGDNGGKISLIYTAYNATQSQWNGWNREHVWPKSLGGNNTTGGGADLHHIRPSDAGVNSSRGNKKYGEINGGTAKYGSDPADGYLGGYYNSTYFEPREDVKGDVARICLYVHVRWGSEWGASNITSVFQSVDVLLQWHLEDPVDTWEMGRNDVVEEIQGNRNVFIDYPEYAWLIFGKAIPAGVTTPSGEGSNGQTPHTHSYTSEVTKQPTCTVAGVTTYTCSCGDSYTQAISPKGHSFTSGVCTTCGATDGTGGNNPGGDIGDESCKHPNTVTKNEKAPTCQGNGYSGDVYCADCDELLVSGNVISSTNAHDFSDWLTAADGVTKYKYCLECGIELELDMEMLLAEIESDAELIILLLSLGISDKIFVDAIK